MKARIELVDEVNAHIHGLDASTRRRLNEKFSFVLPHARHTPAFKLGRWDGKVSFFSIAGKTYVNLLEEILPALLDANYDVEVDDRRSNFEINFDPVSVDHFADRVWPLGHQAAGKPIVLRDYQADIVNNFLKNQIGVQVVGTGAGKTLVTTALSSIVEHGFTPEQQVLYKLSSGSSGGARTIVIVPNKDLVTQTEADYINLGMNVGVYYGDRKELGRTHTICTWQSLEVIRKNFQEGKNEMSLEKFAEGVMAIIVDECHLAKADVLQKLMLGPFSKIPIRWGLTGTMPKEPEFAMAIRIGVGPVVGSLMASDLQDEGVLSSCNINIVQLQDLITYSSYQSEMKYLISDERRLEYIAEYIRQISQDSNTLVLVNNIKTGESIVKTLDSDNIVFVSGKVKSQDRKDEYNKFKTGNGKIVVATYGVASTGIDIIRINKIVLVEPGKSFVRVIQSIGRGLRKGHDKDHVEIYDICSSAKYSKSHMAARKKFYAESNYPYKITKVDWQNATISTKGVKQS